MGPAFAIAFTIQVPLAYLGAVFPMANGLYGAPVPVGESPGISLFGGGPSFFMPFWLIDVVLTALVIFLILRVAAPRSSLWAGAWALLGVLVCFSMQVGVARGVLPFAGLPVPAAAGGLWAGRPVHVVILADAVIWAGAFVWWRHRRLARL